jgi:23S rRNA (cytidine1920-2'-O)/16S rRNA (cytidine1409-2'-O)-methyltransferase
MKLLEPQHKTLKGFLNSMQNKERLDKYLTDLGYFDTKSKAASAILAGHVKINDEYITKAGYQMNLSKEYEIVVKSMPYVSRGGFKLKKALETFQPVVTDRVCFDAGASTGGFTDCLLQNGAKFVYAVDVGYGQLDWKIRSDNRVKTIEKTNLKICTFEDIYQTGEPVADLLVSDLSFISLTKVLPNLKTLLNPEFHELICLIKPQFEAGKDKVEKGGVVRDKKTHLEVIQNVIDCAKTLGYSVKGLTYSSIKGPAGNIEYLVWLSTQNAETKYDVGEIVATAIATLG